MGKGMGMLQAGTWQCTSARPRYRHSVAWHLRSRSSDMGWCTVYGVQCRRQHVCEASAGLCSVVALPVVGPGMYHSSAIHTQCYIPHQCYTMCRTCGMWQCNGSRCCLVLVQRELWCPLLCPWLA